MMVVRILCGLLITAAVGGQGLDPDFAAMKRYDHGASAEPLERITEAVTASHGDPAARRELEQQLVAVMRANDSTVAARWFAARELYRIATPSTASDLAPLLVRADASDMARYVVERIPGSAATDALLNALRVTRGDVRVGILNSLGERRDPASVARVKALTGNGDPKVMAAAMVALGKIGGEESANQLLWCSRNVRHDLRPTATEAYLRCADQFLDGGDRTIAASMYERVYTGPEPEQLRMAALQGLFAANPAEAGRLVVEVFRGSDTAMYAVAAGAIRTVDAVYPAHPILDALPGLRPAHQALLLGALAEQGAPEALPAILHAVDHRDAAVRRAAITGLAAYRDENAVGALLRIAGSGQEDERMLARRSLQRMDMTGLDDRLAKAAMSADNALRTEAIRALGERGASSSVPLLLRTADRDVMEVRLVAVEALGKAAGQEDMGALVALLVQAREPAFRDAAKDAILAAARRLPETADRTREIRKAYRGSRGRADTDLAVVEILGSLKDSSGLETLDRAARRGSGEVSVAAIRSLGQWPDPSPLDTVSRIARRTKRDDERRAAFDAMIRLLRIPADRPVEETLAYYAEATSLAVTITDKRQILSGLAEVGDSRALDLVAPYLADAEVAEEAELAHRRITGEGETS